MQNADPAIAESGTIRARSQRQAMDWSLVLASQGIEHSIGQDATGNWLLLVSPSDAPAAIAVLKQYRLENLRWPWRRKFFKARVVFDWAALAWISLTVALFWLDESRQSLREVGIMNGQRVGQGEWWRLFTATQLHADLPHLATNTVFGFLLLGLALGRYGTGTGLLAAFLAGVGGNLASWAVNGNAHQSLGASGVVMGALGLLAAQSVAWLKQSRHALRLAIGGVVGGLMMFLLLGVSENSDVVAHFGGFVSGLILGAMLALAAKIVESPSANLLSLAGFAALIVWTWALAFGHRH